MKKNFLTEHTINRIIKEVIDLNVESENKNFLFFDEHIIEDDYVIYFKNLQDTYRVDETSKVRLGVRDVYPEQSYDRNYNQITQKKLPETTYYSIIDHVTKTPFVEFNTIGTKIQTDDNGHFFELDTSNFLPERYYSIIFKIEIDGSSNIYRNSNFSCRVTQ